MFILLNQCVEHCCCVASRCRVKISDIIFLTVGTCTDTPYRLSEHLISIYPQTMHCVAPRGRFTCPATWFESTLALASLFRHLWLEERASASDAHFLCCAVQTRFEVRSHSGLKAFTSVARPTLKLVAEPHTSTSGTRRTNRGFARGYPNQPRHRRLRCT